jgi:hypothetical protein
LDHCRLLLGRGLWRRRRGGRDWVCGQTGEAFCENLYEVLDVTELVKLEEGGKDEASAILLVLLDKFSLGRGETS